MAMHQVTNETEGQASIIEQTTTQTKYVVEFEGSYATTRNAGMIAVEVDYPTLKTLADAYHRLFDHQEGSEALRWARRPGKA